MAFSQLALILGVVLAVGISSSSACDTGKMQECATLQTELASAASGGMQAVCNVLNKLKKCMSDAGCKDVYASVEKSIDPEGTLCAGSTGSGSTGSGTNTKTDCSENAYDLCLTGATRDKPCPAFKCVQNLKAACKDSPKGFQEFYNEHKDLYDKAKAKCGCCNVQPSIIAILATALIMALRSYF